MTLFICQFCGRETTNAGANKKHENRCKLNPNPKSKKTKSKKWLKSMEKRRGRGKNQYTKAKELGLPKPTYERSHIPLSGVAIATTEQRSQWAKDAGTGGYKPNAGRSKKFRVVDSFGNETVLQSTYELNCSIILNKMNIIWVRPKHLKYDGDKKYFADFYLPEYDLYLDPKNNYKAKQDEAKIQKVIECNKVNVYILTKDKISEEYITSLVSPNGEGLS